MKTKDRILLKALELFNEDGLKEVTLRKIAGALGISQGNLNYHFKTKADIISQLYYRLVDKMDHETEKITQEQPIFSFLRHSSLTTMKILYEYRFIIRDLYKVLESNADLKVHYLQLQQLRKQQYLFLFQNMIQEGLLRKAELDKEYERLYERMNILSDNWINAADFFIDSHTSKVTHYHALLFEVIYPYLTEKGKKQYLELSDIS